GANDTVTVTLESGNPYRHYIAWVYVLSATPDINVQPKFAGANDGGVVNIGAKGATVVFKVPMEEIRPATRGIHKHPADNSIPNILKSELVISNEDVTNHIEFSVYMIAMATPGGA
ncbi:hypothetical protein KAR91_04915, partial [Candidatus Pacearchaeota archaeon]|nr:hypothetical protein [Candidatus Pacearchaeota archaeon]